MQDTELPIVLNDLPNFRLKQVKQNKKNLKQKDPIEVGFEFIKTLESKLEPTKAKDEAQKQKILDELYCLYDNEFNYLSKIHFDQTMWPAPEKIEEVKEIELKDNTIQFYNELRYRHVFARLQNTQYNNIDTLKNSWETYVNIFDEFRNPNTNISIPPAWIWDIIDEFVYQFTQSYKIRTNPKNQQEEGLKELLDEAKDDEVFWNLESVIQNLADLSKCILSVDNGVKKLNDQEKPFNNYIAHYALVGLIRVYTVIGQYEKAIDLIEYISYASLFIYSRAIPSYLTLFYYAGTTYLMSQRYKEAVYLFKAIVLFYQKNKEYLSDSFQSDNMNKQAEKCLTLLLLTNVLFPTKFDEKIQQVLEQEQLRQNQKQEKKQDSKSTSLLEKKRKLEQFNQEAFSDIFEQGFPKIVQVLQNMQEVIKPVESDSCAKKTEEIKEKLKKEFLNSQFLNGISQTLKIYSNISIEKISKLLKLSVEDSKKYLESYQSRDNSSIKKEVPFEQSILSRFLLNNQDSCKFTIENGSINVPETAERNYTQYFTSENNKLVEMEAKIAKIGNV